MRAVHWCRGYDIIEWLSSINFTDSVCCVYIKRGVELLLFSFILFLLFDMPIFTAFIISYQLEKVSKML